jgi:hypothetical protein
MMVVLDTHVHIDCGSYVTRKMLILPHTHSEMSP